MAPRQHLDESIAHLRKELASGVPLSPADHTLLDRTLAEIAVHLDHNPDHHPDHHPDHEHRAPGLAHPLYDELRALAARVEESRPNLSILLGRVIDALSQLGI